MELPQLIQKAASISSYQAAHIASVSHDHGFLRLFDQKIRL